MNAYTEAWRHCAPAYLIGCAALLAASGAGGAAAARADGPLGPSERPEAYFNGSSYIRISEPLSLKQLVGLSFRTCVGGELFSQRFEGFSLHVTALLGQLVVSWARQGLQREVALPARTLDNRWHWVALRYRPDPPSIHLTLDKETQVISNVTWNPELLSPGALEAGGATLLVGNVFSGCLREGPQLEFHAARSSERHVVFGPCPLTTDECTDRKDVLRIPPKDHCLNEPCMRHGSCISRHDRYECHCTARYTGNNCEVDAGSPCLAAPCRHGGRCQELPQGDYRCDCLPNYRGEHCELEVSLDPQCVAEPCLNNGSCSVPPGSDTYVCDCPPGFTGRECETDIDECAAAGPGACLHGGRCRDARGNYTCDCSGTGYTGARCGENVNECLTAGICGHGACYDTHGGHVCACRAGYTGARCDVASACASGPCGVGGACVEEAGVWRCVCAKGFAPPLCAAPAPPPPPPACRHLDCPPRSHCRETRAAAPAPPGTLAGVVLTKQVVCVCDPGFYGLPGPAPNCSSAESACAAGACLNGGSCSARADRLECLCAPGYKGAYCEQPAPAPAAGAGPAAAAAAGKALEPRPAERCAAAPCAHAIDCQDQPNGFHCECQPGWTGARCDVPAGAAGGAGGAGAAADEGCVRCAGGACPEAAPACVCCDPPPDCRAQPCPPLQECVEEQGVWACAAADRCADAPCHNGSCVPADAGFRCLCPAGVTGRYCEADVDECTLMPKICNFGVCVNVPGSYQCYCRPGYTGDSCEQDIDECLSAPCKNGGTCQNLENNFECDCPEGFGGKDCSVDINECLPEPCAAGSTCVDGVASYQCVCQPGLTGRHCEIDIDDCESAPCQHGGHCVDQVHGYSCECAGTGHAGADCELNVDECASRPCRHGAACRDGLNDYHCLCHPGYTGKDCETDANECEPSPCQHGGVCLQRSDAALYRAADAPPERVGPQPHMLLPRLFYRPFSYENASGYECVCVDGTRGERCEVNVDECASAPCGHGTCADAVGGYSCLCAAGYEGAHCEREIDECERYHPCAHGRCFDRRASYYCACAEGWGGRNCTVELQGCRAAPCRHGGTCRPWLRGETEHRYNCSCRPGHQGATCQRITTMSLEKSSFVEVNTTREEGYDISLRFKTTLGNGLLAMGRGVTYFFLELSNGRLNLHSSLLNKWEGVFIGSNLNDSNWQKVFVTINSSHVVLAANEEQTIYPISQTEAVSGSTAFPSTRLGTAGSSYATLTHGPNFFVGCFQDVLVNGLWVLPEDPAPESEAEASSTEPEAEAEGAEAEAEAAAEGGAGGAGLAAAALRGVAARCPRRAQCEPNPCRSGGACEDAWTSYTCTCPRPYLGDTCQYNYTAATFAHETARRRAAAAVRVGAAARAAVRALQALHISMFIRTRQPTGVIFYLGSGPKYGAADETLVGAMLRGGELLVQLRFNQTPEEYAVGGTRLDNGYVHLIEVVRNSTLVQVKLNGTEYFRKSVSAAKQLDAQVLYLGGPPPPAAPPADAPPTAATPPPDEADFFKGVIQDVQISNGVNVSVVELFPLASGLPGLATLPPAFGEVTLPPGGAVRRGVVSDDACASTPCLHDAVCTTTWNDYECACPRGYKGKQCAEVEFCQLQGCPLNSHCRNLDQGYECVSNATFDGVNTTLAYQLRAGRLPGAAAAAPPPPATLQLAYRSRAGGTLLHAAAPVGWLSVAALHAQVAVQWRLGGALPRVRRMRVAPAPPGGWLTVRFTFVRDTITGAFVDADGKEHVGLTEALDTQAWQQLATEGVIQLGGVRPVGPAPAPPTPPAAPADAPPELPVWEYGEGEEPPADNSVGEYFKGCMGAVHIGGLLLPFFTEEELFVGAAAALLAAQPHYALLSGRPWGAATGVGCVLCLERDCAHGGHCADVRSLYTCACPKGFSGDYCEVDVDECLANECKNGATCRDGIASYTCECPEGYDGEFCENDIDECQSAPCGPGATCTDLPGGFRCACPPARAGPTCAARASCLARPCGPHAVACRDVPPDPPSGNNYTCECASGYAGEHCELPYCQLRPCQRGTCRLDAESPYCECEEGFAGLYCEATSAADAAPADCGGCLHAGRCVPAPRPRCDCEGTGWHGAHCENDVDECALGLVSCGPGECRNLEGSYICECAEGFCGNECALLDPCFQPAPPPPEGEAGAEGEAAEAAGEAGGGAALGPCAHGARCSQRCTAAVDYVCACSHGWAGRNCSQQAAWGAGAGGGWAGGWRWALGAGGALLLLLALGGGAAAAAGARRTRATRGTYSPSGQEYCNPRATTQRALQPPPEERLI